MKAISTPKLEKNKENSEGNIFSKFYLHHRRVSEDDSISPMAALCQRSRNSNINFSQNLRHLNHFKKNSNKVECNIQQDKRDFLQTFQITRKSKTGLTNLKSDVRRSDISQIKSHTRNFTMTQGFYKPIIHIGISQIIRNNKVYPRYKVLELYSLYQSILKYSQKKPGKFLQAFQSYLNYQKIMIKPQIVKKHLFQSKSMEFKDFLLTYKKMQDLMFIQSIIDYLEIIFEVYSQESMTYSMVFQILAKRSEANLAESITDLIFRSLGKEKQQTINLQSIVELCEKDLQFCSKFSRVYHHDTY